MTGRNTSSAYAHSHKQKITQSLFATGSDQKVDIRRRQGSRSTVSRRGIRSNCLRGCYQRIPRGVVNCDSQMQHVASASPVLTLRHKPRDVSRLAGPVVPINEIRTFFLMHSSTSLCKYCSNRRMRADTSSAGRFQLSEENAYRVSA